MNVLVDTNVLIRISDTASLLRNACKEALSRLLLRGDDLIFCTQACPCSFTAER